MMRGANIGVKAKAIGEGFLFFRGLEEIRVIEERAERVVIFFPGSDKGRIGGIYHFDQIEFFDFVLENHIDIHAHEDFKMFIAEVFIEFPEPGKEKIPDKEKEVLTTGEDIFNDLFEGNALVGD